MIPVSGPSTPEDSPSSSEEIAVVAAGRRPPGSLPAAARVLSVVRSTFFNMRRTDDSTGDTGVVRLFGRPGAEPPREIDQDDATVAYWARVQELRTELAGLRPAN